MELSPIQRDALITQLVKAFDLDAFDRMVQTAVGLTIAHLAEPGTVDTVILRAVREVERRGQLEKVVTAARRERPYVQSLARIAEEVEMMLRDSTLDGTAQELITLIRAHQVDEAVLAIYRRFASSNTIDLEMPVDRVAYGIKRLAQSTPPRDQYHPLLLCGAYLGFDEWLNAAMAKFGIPRTKKSALKRQAKKMAAQYEDTALHLLVAVRPMGDSLLNVRAWSQLFDENGEAKCDAEPLGDYQTCTSETLPYLLSEFLLGAEERRPANSSLTVEVFLPIELLNFPLDQQVYQAPEQEPARFGTRFPLVVRSFNRTYESRALVQKEWLRLWQRSRPNKHRVFRGGHELFNGRYGLVVRDHHEASHVILDFVPGPDAIRVMIGTGTSFALWPRKGTEGYEAMVTEFEKNLTWPQAVRKHRIAAALSQEPEAHAGSHLTLLWDEPSRLPPDAQNRFQMPGETS